MTLRSGLAAWFALALVTTGCAPAASTTPVRRQEVVVFAASSLTDVLSAVKTTVESRSPNLRIAINFGASSVLRTQLEQGAQADLFIAADQRQMQLAAGHSLLAAPSQVVARNQLVLIVPASNPGNVTSVNDLARPGLRFVMAGADVPIGRYARQSLANMDKDAAFGATFSSRVLANAVSQEANVRAIVTKIQLGEGDAALVYSTDVTAGARGQVRVLAIPDEFNVLASYPAALINGGRNLPGAETLLNYLLSPAGQDDFRRFGFLPAAPTIPASPTPTR